MSTIYLLRPRRVQVLASILTAAVALLCSSFVSADEPQPVEKETSLTWLSDYHAGVAQAKEEKKMLLVWFLNPRDAENGTKYMNSLYAKKEIAAKLPSYVLVQVPTDYCITCDGKEMKLLQHGCFAEMLNSQGIAILDFAHEKTNHYGHVVSVYPFNRRWITQQHLAALLDLPEGTLTQRTLTWAIRTHPEAPASAYSTPSKFLFTSAESHSNHQANIGVQGHHNWESRFHTISGAVGGSASEVVAESWPGQNLVEAAEECVHSWRQSPGHWNGVRSRHAVFGYDMKRGNNGIWYGTGIFGR
jgi:hypothetical protein